MVPAIQEQQQPPNATPGPPNDGNKDAERTQQPANDNQPLLEYVRSDVGVFL